MAHVEGQVCLKNTVYIAHQEPSIKDLIESGDFVFWTRYLNLQPHVSLVYLLSLQSLVCGLQEKSLILWSCLECSDSFLHPSFLLSECNSSTFTLTTWTPELLPALRSQHSHLWLTSQNAGSVSLSLNPTRLPKQ